MLPWVEQGVRQSLETLARLRGFEPPVSIPSLGPSVSLVRPEAFDVLEVESDARINRLAITIASPWWSVGITNSAYDDPCDHLLIEHCSIEGGNKWASRAYRMRRGNRINRCAFRGTFPEHDIYWNIAGYGGDAGDDRAPALIVSNTYFQDTGSQNLQLVQRSTDWYGQTPAQDLTPGGLIAVHDTLSRNAGNGGDRPAFAFSFFASQNPVAIARLMVDKSMQDSSTGLLLVEKRSYCAVNGSAFLAGNLIQPFAIFRDIDKLVLRNCFFHATGGQRWVQIERCKTVSIDGCEGASIHLDGADIGPIEKGLHLTH